MLDATDPSGVADGLPAPGSVAETLPVATFTSKCSVSGG